MKFILFSAFLAISFASLVRADTLTPPTPDQQHRLNEKIYYCTWCHADNGAEPIYPAARLAAQNSTYLENQLNHFVDHTRDGPMSHEYMWGAVRHLDSDLIPYLADYFSKQTTWPLLSSNTELVAKGKQIYTDGIPSRGVMACVACHGPEGKGADGVPRLASQEKLYIIRQLHDWQHGYRAYAEPMPTFAKALQEDEIQALAEFVSTF